VADTVSRVSGQAREAVPRRIGSPDQTAIAGRLTTAVSLTVPSVSSVM
jgi:hypothetical protein